ncbi:carboxylate--amine ligase [Halorussus lipolyticus]|uniref:carboxylate--amine ligase n=1 Tax=Halorussus lipolyticus TaxID=3034024 RepID=UPI0023E80BBE|nr:carboxylate--amine ligase [Halorussus sp. DT80]
MPPQSHTSDAGVVVPAIHAASSLACLRSLSEEDARTIAIADDPTAPGLSSKYCDETITVPDPTSDLDAYERKLLTLARRDDVRTIIPVREADIYVLARNRDALSSVVGTPWPDLETLRSVQDRVRLFESAEDAGVSTPRTKVLDEWDDWGRESIVKPRYTLHASEYAEEFAESTTETHSTQYVPADTEPDPEEFVSKMGHVPLVQEYVPDSDEYAFFALYDEGDPVATFQHRQRRGCNYCGGPSAFRESVDIPALDSAGRRLLDELDWHGLAMVEFLRNPATGDFELMEINPRFWTSLPFTVQAGVDFPAYYWRQATGESERIDADYEVGTAGHLLRGELCHLHSIVFDDYPLVERPSFVRSAAEVLTSLVRHPRFDYLDPSDPRPFLRDVRNTFGALVGGGEVSDPRKDSAETDASDALGTESRRQADERLADERPTGERLADERPTGERLADKRLAGEAPASPVGDDPERESRQRAMVDGGQNHDESHG